MEFVNSTIAARYSMPVGDCNISIPGRYNGQLSEVAVDTILDGMLQRNSNLVALKDGGGTGVVNSGAHYQFTGAADQVVFPLPGDGQAAAIHNALKSTKLLIVAAEGTMLTQGAAINQYQYTTATGTITFNQPISNQEISIHYFK